MVMVPFDETIYQTLVRIAERIIKTAEEKVGGPVKIISTEPLIAGTVIGSELITYDFDTDLISREVLNGQKTA